MIKQGLRLPKLLNWVWWNSPASVKGKISMNYSVGLAPAVAVWATWLPFPVKTQFSPWRPCRAWCVRWPLPGLRFQAPVALMAESAVAVLEAAAAQSRRLPSQLMASRQWLQLLNPGVMSRNYWLFPWMKARNWYSAGWVSTQPYWLSQPQKSSIMFW